ncbi:MAG: hypothetical protein IIZ06_03815 [Kiritimatiellae bacterium]|nr:hypothetical protein [Kiritimatiellia bacterium]
MRLTFAIAVAVAACAACAKPEPEYWYTPEGGWLAGDAGVATVVIGGKDVTYDVGYDGISLNLQKKIIEYQSEGAYELANALQTLYEALQAQIMVRNMAERLNGLFNGGTAGYEASGGGTSKGSFSFNFNGGAVSLNLSGVTGVSAGGGLRKNSNTLSLANWSDDPTGWTLAEQLSAKVMTGHENLEVIARLPGSAASRGLAYVPIGMGIGGGAGGLVPDNETLSTNSQNAIEIKGWSNGGKETASSEWTFPAANSKQGVRWIKYGDFFSTAMFDFGDESGDKASEYAAVRLKGGSVETPARHYFGTSEDAGVFGFFGLPSTNAPDGVSIVFDESGNLALPGLGSAQPGQSLTYLSSGVLGWRAPGDASIHIDEDSLTINSTGKVQLANFEEPMPPSDTVSSLLADAASGGEESGYLFLVRPADGETIDYIRVGDGISQGGGAAIKFVGTDSSEAVVGIGGVTNTLTFASATNSNVRVSVEGDGSGNATVTIGAYWR